MGADGVGGAGDGASEGARTTDWWTLVAATPAGSGASEPEATVAAALRRLRRGLAVELSESIGVMVQVNENSCSPATCQTVKRAFSPLSIQLSYKEMKSSRETAGGVRCCCWDSTHLPSLPSNPAEGEAGRQRW